MEIFWGKVGLLRTSQSELSVSLFLTECLLKVLNLTSGSSVANVEPERVFEDLYIVFAFRVTILTYAFQSGNSRIIFLALFPTREEPEMVGHFSAFIFIYQILTGKWHTHWEFSKTGDPCHNMGGFMDVLSEVFL